MTYKFNAHVKTLRHLLSELRQASSTGRLNHSPLTGFVFLQYKKFRTTTHQICRAREEMSCLVNSYVTYLQSSRQYQELLKTYHTAKEKSVEEAANIVGYKLPQDPDPYLKR
uniref:Protein FMC1 homolog n=1 Tax=Lygus hesperus TaxID=30085 RepID=A0A146L703_LYGHE